MDATAWDARYAGADLVWSSTPNRFVEELVAPMVPGRALDLAAGEGRNALWLAERGWDVTSADFSAVAVERAREIAAERLDLARGLLAASEGRAGVSLVGGGRVLLARFLGDTPEAVRRDLDGYLGALRRAVGPYSATLPRIGND